MKKVLIIGGTGSWGQELTKQILDKYKSVEDIRIYSRGEHKQVEMKRNFNNKKLTFIIGGIRDISNLKLAGRFVDNRNGNRCDTDKCKKKNDKLIKLHISLLKYIKISNKYKVTN